MDPALAIAWRASEQSDRRDHGLTSGEAYVVLMPYARARAQLRQPRVRKNEVHGTT